MSSIGAAKGGGAATKGEIGALPRETYAPSPVELGTCPGSLEYVFGLMGEILTDRILSNLIR